MEGHNSRFNCIQFDQAIEFILTLIAAGGKLEGTSVSFDTSNVSNADSIAVGKASVQAIIEEIIKKGVRSIDIIQSETGPKLRYNKLDGDYKDVALPTADQIRYLSSPTAQKTAGAALTDLYNKVAELQRGGVTTEQIQKIIQDWLDAHPEATTSVPDGSITLAKLATEVKTAIENAGRLTNFDMTFDIEERASDYLNFEICLFGKDKNGNRISETTAQLEVPSATSAGAGFMSADQARVLDIIADKTDDIDGLIDNVETAFNRATSAEKKVEDLSRIVSDLGADREYIEGQQLGYVVLKNNKVEVETYDETEPSEWVNIDAIETIKSDSVINGLVAPYDNYHIMVDMAAKRIYAKCPNAYVQPAKAFGYGKWEDGLWNIASNNYINEDGTPIEGKSYRIPSYRPLFYRWDGTDFILQKKTATINLLTASAINKSNTIYEVRYDFNLNGGTIRLNKGVILKFTGGSICNGTIELNGAIQLEGEYAKCFKNVRITEAYKSGSFINNIVHSNIFDCDGTTKWANLSWFNGCILDEDIVSRANNVSTYGQHTPSYYIEGCGHKLQYSILPYSGMAFCTFGELTARDLYVENIGGEDYNRNPNDTILSPSVTDGYNANGYCTFRVYGDNMNLDNVHINTGNRIFGNHSVTTHFAQEGNVWSINNCEFWSHGFHIEDFPSRLLCKNTRFMTHSVGVWGGDLISNGALARNSVLEFYNCVVAGGIERDNTDTIIAYDTTFFIGSAGMRGGTRAGEADGTYVRCNFFGTNAEIFSEIANSDTTAKTKYSGMSNFRNLTFKDCVFDIFVEKAVISASNLLSFSINDNVTISNCTIYASRTGANHTLRFADPTTKYLNVNHIRLRNNGMSTKISVIAVSTAIISKFEDVVADYDAVVNFGGYNNGGWKYLAGKCKFIIPEGKTDWGFNFQGGGSWAANCTRINVGEVTRNSNGLMFLKVTPSLCPCQRIKIKSLPTTSGNIKIGCGSDETKYIDYAVTNEETSIYNMLRRIAQVNVFNTSLHFVKLVAEDTIDLYYREEYDNTMTVLSNANQFIFDVGDTGVEYEIVSTELGKTEVWTVLYNPSTKKFPWTA